MPVETIRKRGLILSCVLLCLVVLAIDTRIELGVAGGVPYVAVILIAMYLRNERWMLFFTVVCTALIALGYVLSPSGGEFWKVISNRVLAVIAIWITALLSLQFIRTKIQVEAQRDRLEEQVHRRTAEARQINKELQGQVEQLHLSQQALRASERRYRTLYEDNPTMYFTVDRDMTVLSVNRFGAEQLGYVVEELAGQPVLNVVYPDDRDFVSRAILACFQDPRETADWEFRKIRKDGSILWVKEAVRVILDSRDEPVALVVCKDITNRKQAQQKLRTRLRYERGLAGCCQALHARVNSGHLPSEALTHLLEASDASRVYVFENFEDPQQGLCMRQVAEVCAAGISADIHDPLLQHLPYSHLSQEFSDAMSNGRPVNEITASLQPREKELLETHGVLSILMLPIRVDGQWYGFIGFDDCVTERRWSDEDVELLKTAADIIGSHLGRQRAQDALARTEHMYRQVLDAIVDMVIVKDRGSRITWANKAFRDYYGMSNEQLRDKIDSPFNKPAYTRQYLDDDQRVFDTGKPLNVSEEPVTRQDGAVRFFETVKSPVYGSQNRVSHLVAVCRDVTERKHAQRVLEEKNAQLQLLQVVAATANQATDVDRVLQVALDEVCALTGWPVGHVYMPAEGNPELLKPTSLWHVDNPHRFKVFREVTEATDFAHGIGLPGRVLASGQPAWIIDVTKDPNFLRAKLANDIGVRGAFGFPVLVGSEVAAVLEFYSDAPAQPDEAMLEIMVNVGTQLGRVIERTRSQMALQENEQIYRSTFDDAPVGITHVDADGRFLRVNTTLCEMLGYTKEQMTRLRFNDVTHLEDRRTSLEWFEKLSSGELEALRVDKRYQRLDGSSVWAHLTVRPLRSSTGKIKYFIAIIEDITDRKNIEKRLGLSVKREQAARSAAEQSEQQIFNIIERISDAFVALDENWRYTYVNQKAGQIFQRRPDELIGKNIWEEFPEGVGQPFHLAYEKAVVQQETVELEEYYPPWEKWFENRIYPSPDGLSIFFRDVTDRKRAESKLVKSEEFNRLLVETVPCGIAHISTDGAVLHANAEAQRLMGFSYDEITRRDVSDWGGKNPLGRRPAMRGGGLSDYAVSQNGQASARDDDRRLHPR